MNIMGDNRMTADQVIDTCIGTPKREDLFKNRKDTAVNPVWQPISHSKFVEAMHNAFEAHDISVLDSSFALNKTGHLLVGGFQVKGAMLPHLPQDVDGVYEVFCRHANDMSRGIQLSAGVQLMVCTNGCMSGEVIASRKHTSGFDVYDWAKDQAIGSFVEDCAKQVDFIHQLRDVECSDQTAAECILEAGRRGILPKAQTVDVYEEWKNPVFSTEDFPLNSAWKLYGDMTHVAQKCSPARQLQVVQESSPLVMEFCTPNLAGVTF